MTRVLLLKSPGKVGKDPYVQGFESIGVPCQCIPVLDFEFVNLTELSARLSKPDSYNGLILTSPRAVEAVEKAIDIIRQEWTSDLAASWKSKPVYVVGAATGKEVESRLVAWGLTPKGAESGSAEALVKVVLDDSADWPQERSLLFPASSLARDVIPTQLSESGVRLQQIAAYRTIPHPAIGSELAKVFAERPPSHVVFFSPSGVEFTWDVWRHLGVDLNSLKCIAIGETTRQALTDRGVNSTAAAKPTAEAVLDLVKQQHP